MNKEESIGISGAERVWNHKVGCITKRKPNAKRPPDVY